MNNQYWSKALSQDNDRDRMQNSCVMFGWTVGEDKDHDGDKYYSSHLEDWDDDDNNFDDYSGADFDDDYFDNCDYEDWCSDDFDS